MKLSEGETSGGRNSEMPHPLAYRYKNRIDEVQRAKNRCTIGPGRDFHPPALLTRVYRLQDLSADRVLFQPVTELAHRGLIWYS